MVYIFCCFLGLPGSLGFKLSGSGSGFQIATPGRGMLVEHKPNRCLNNKKTVLEIFILPLSRRTPGIKIRTFTENIVRIVYFLEYFWIVA